jgi:hypothetical protein
VLSNEEINDLIKYSPTPVRAAQRVLSFAEEMGSEDNATAIVIPLLGWGKCTGIDGTKELREYRSGQMGICVHFVLHTSLMIETFCRGQKEDVEICPVISVDLLETARLSYDYGQHLHHHY